MPLYDFECSQCELKTEQFAPYQESATYKVFCPSCAATTKHKRLPSLFAPYMGEKVANPMMSGGKFDTLGNARVQRLPSFKEADEHDAKLRKAVDALPLNATKEQIESTMNAVGPGPDLAAWKDHVKSSDFREAKKKRAEDVKRNRAKRARAAALARGEVVNMRRDRLPGDPKF